MKREYNKIYNREHYKSIAIRLSPENDSDIFRRLKEVPNITKYLSDLIREDIQRASYYKEMEEIVDYQALDVKRWTYELIDEMIPGTVWYSVGYGESLDDIKLLMMNYVESAPNTGVLHTIRRYYDPDRHCIVGEDLSRRSR